MQIHSILSLSLAFQGSARWGCSKHASGCQDHHADPVRMLIFIIFSTKFIIVNANIHYFGRDIGELPVTNDEK